jgi:hypothetical protein
MAVVQETAVNAGAAFFNLSDSTRKQNIRQTRYGLADLLNVGVYDYTFKGDPNQTQQVGFLAQQLYTVMPEAVSKPTGLREDEQWMVDYSRLTPLLVAGVQELHQKFVELQQQQYRLASTGLGVELPERLNRVEVRLNTHDTELASLRTQIAELQAQVAELRTLASNGGSISSR